MFSKDWIKNNLFTKVGNLNNRVCLDSWWVNKDYTVILEQLQALTQYLPVQSTTTERLYNIYNGLYTRTYCYCGKEPKFINFKDGYRKYCSLKCSTQCPERNLKISQNRNMEEIMAKTKQSNLEKYGVEHIFQTPEFALKSKETKTIRYGTDTYNNLQQAQETNIVRYGVPWTGQILGVIGKSEETKSLRHPELRDKAWLITQNLTKSVQQISAELGVSYRTVYLWFQKHDITMNFFSVKHGKEQKELQDYIQSLGNINIKILIKFFLYK